MLKQSMSQEFIQVQVRGVVPAKGSYAIFLGDDHKVFVIQVEQAMGRVIEGFASDSDKERPLTHDLMLNCFTGFGISVERVVIVDLRGSTYYARLVLKQENELGQNIVDVDARPSDSIALAIAEDRPIFVSRELFEQIDDMSPLLRKLKKGQFGSASEEEF